MSKKSQGIRARRTHDGRVIELWLGPPGEAESDCLAQFDQAYLPGVFHTLENIEKVPVVESSMIYGMKTKP